MFPLNGLPKFVEFFNHNYVVLACDSQQSCFINNGSRVNTGIDGARFITTDTYGV